MRHFPILSFFLYLLLLLFFLEGRGGGSKLSIMIGALKRNRTEQPPPPRPNLPENKDELRKSHNMPFIWGRWGELMKSFCLFCQKIALQ